jgi:hypothetical protein
MTKRAGARQPRRCASHRSRNRPHRGPAGGGRECHHGGVPAVERGARVVSARLGRLARAVHERGRCRRAARALALPNRALTTGRWAATFRRTPGVAGAWGRPNAMEAFTTTYGYRRGDGAGASLSAGGDRLSGTTSTASPNAAPLSGYLSRNSLEDIVHHAAAPVGVTWKPRAAARRLSAATLRSRCCSSYRCWPWSTKASPRVSMK